MKRKHNYSQILIWMYFILLISFITLLWACARSPYHENKDVSQETGVKETEQEEIYIPKNLEEAFIELDKLFPQDLKKDLKTGKTQPIELHFGAGMWLRNNWGLWQGSRLAMYFNELGIFHPDDMSGIILDSYTQRLRGEPSRFEKQIQRYQEY